MSHRFHVPDAAVTGTVVPLPAEEAEHLRRVLRLGPGAHVSVFDGRGHEWEAEVADCDRQQATVRLLRTQLPRPEPSVAVVLVAAVLKGDGMEHIVRDAVMLGVHAIRPVVTARTEISLAALARSERAARWRRIAVASAKQCGRAVVPVVSDPVPLDDVLSRMPAYSQRLCLVEPAVAPAGTVSVSAVGPAPARAALLVGPEGGWAPEELRSILAAGWTPVSVGTRTLRAETVPVVALTAVSVVWRDL